MRALAAAVMLAAAPGAPVVAEETIELLVPAGEVKGVGTNVTLVLKQRSLRAEDYVVGTWSAAKGFTKLKPFPVRTYRGHVQGRPALRVNADIEPGGLLWANISAGRGYVGEISGLNVDLPAGGKSTPVMSAGNVVTPVKATRTAPTPNGYMVPPQPMRRISVVFQAARTNLDLVGGDRETLVSQSEQRVNDTDFIYARDAGIAWEINTLIIRLDDSEVDFGKVNRVAPGRHGNLNVIATSNGKAHTWGGGTFKAGGMAPLSCGGLYRGGGGLSHEAGHKFRGIHNADEGGDCMGGGGAFIGSVNAQLMIKYCEEGTEAVFPGVIYDGELPPFCGDDMANTLKDQPVSIDVLDNDYDGNGDQVLLQAVSARTGQGGRVELSPDGKKVIYTPAPGFFGLDRFTYTARDASGAMNETGRVKVDVRVPGLAYYFPLDRWEKGKFADMGPLNTQGSTWAIPFEFYSGVVSNAAFCPNLGTRGYAYFPDASPAGRWSVSVSLWVLYPDPASLSNQAVLITQGGCMNGTIEGGARSGWGIGHCSGGKGFKFAGNVSQTGSGFDLRSDELIQPLKWYHLVAVFDRDARQMRAWVNNQEVLKSDTTSRIPDGIMEGTGGVYLFNGYTWKKGAAARALLDEIRIYSDALTPQAVARLYAVGKDAAVPDFKTGRISPTPGAPQSP